MEIKSDIDIAQATTMDHIMDIAKTAGIDEKYVEQYGNYKAKLDLSLLKDLADKPNGKLILVTRRLRARARRPRRSASATVCARSARSPSLPCASLL